MPPAHMSNETRAMAIIALTGAPHLRLDRLVHGHELTAGSQSQLCDDTSQSCGGGGGLRGGQRPASGPNSLKGFRQILMRGSGWWSGTLGPSPRVPIVVQAQAVDAGPAGEADALSI